MDDCAAEPLLLDPAPGDQGHEEQDGDDESDADDDGEYEDSDDDDKSEDGDKDEDDDNCMVELVNFTEVAMKCSSF